MIMRHFYLLVFLCCSLICTAQNSYKHEKEDRIEKKVFPSNALELLDKTLPKKVKKVTYYKEQDSAKVNYKIKLNYNDTKYSIEFSKKGILENVEITSKQKDITPKTLEKIKKYLYNKFASFRIKKIQRQYRNTTNTAAESIIKDAFSHYKKRVYYYEIVAEIKTEEKRYFIEITFTKNGDFELERIIN
jgi:hypothetical protein